MARIYASHSFKASSVNAKFYRYLESLDDDAVVLLEFVSQGPNNRQVDCAILSSGGVDLIEVKDKQGKIEGYTSQAWRVIDSRGKASPIINRKNGQQENPFEQAANTAEDFERYLREALGVTTKVFPLVVIPEAHPESRFDQHHQTRIANGVGEVGHNLRAYKKRHKYTTLHKQDVEKIIERLGLTPVGMAFLEGRAVEERTGKGLPGVEVYFKGEQLESDLFVRTDEQGRYEAALPVGRVKITFKPPSGLESIEIDYQAHQGNNLLEDIELIRSPTPAEPEPSSHVVAEVLQLLEKERRDREALYELLLEQSTQPKQGSGEKAHIQVLERELTEIRRYLQELTRSRTAQEQQDAARQIQQFLAELATHTKPALSAETQQAGASDGARATSTSPARKLRLRIALSLAVAAVVLGLGAGAWLLQNRPADTAALTPTSTPSKPVASKEEKAPVASPPKVTSPSSSQKTTQPTQQEIKPSVKAEEPRKAVQPVQTQPGVKTPVSTTPQRSTSNTASSKPTPSPRTNPVTTSTKTAAIPRPTNTQTAKPGQIQTASEALPGVPVQARSQPVTTATQEELPGTPVQVKPSTQQTTETLPDEERPGRALSFSQGIPPAGMECPESHPIKGNISGDRMIYHLPEQEFYEQTRPEVCFASAGEAAQAGFRPSRR